jgi:hypothetical protein
MFGGNEVNVSSIELGNFVDLSGLGDDQISSIEVGVEDASSEGEFVCRLGDDYGIIALGEGDGFEVRCSWQFKVFIISIVENTLRRRNLTLNLYTPGYE